MTKDKIKFTYTVNNDAVVFRKMKKKLNWYKIDPYPYRVCFIFDEDYNDSYVGYGFNDECNDIGTSIISLDPKTLENYDLPTVITHLSHEISHLIETIENYVSGDRFHGEPRAYLEQDIMKTALEEYEKQMKIKIITRK